MIKKIVKQEGKTFILKNSSMINDPLYEHQRKELLSGPKGIEDTEEEYKTKFDVVAIKEGNRVHNYDVPKGILGKSEGEILDTIGKKHVAKTSFISKGKLISFIDIISIQNLTHGLNSTKGNVSPGLDGEVKSDITEKRIAKLHEELKTQKYHPKPVKKVGIPKPDGGTRYLGLASQIDKIVQGAIKNLLEPKLESMFLDVSYGFRPNLSCHNVLKEIKYGWKAISWIINIDIAKCFDRIQHELLLEKLKSHVDQATCELIRKMLKAGYVNTINLTDKSEDEGVGTPQGSLISPLLCNLFLHDLDKYVTETLSPEYNRGIDRAVSEEYNIRYTTTDYEKEMLKKYPEMKKALRRIKHNRFIADPSVSPANQKDENFRRLKYVRYADDFMIGFIGPKKEAEDIFEKVKNFLRINLSLEINKEKSKIYHATEKNIKYLGVYIRYNSHNKITESERIMAPDDIADTMLHLKSQTINAPQYRVPVDKIIKRLVDRGIAKMNSDTGIARATSFYKISMLEDPDIVERFSSIIRGIMNYYSCVNHKSDLWKIFTILRKSCALTLANKHGLGSAARAFSKFGPKLKTKDNLGRSRNELFYPESLKTDISFRIGGSGFSTPNILEEKLEIMKGSYKTNLKTAEMCEFEGCEETENLEAHHINKVGELHKRKDLSEYTKALIVRERKVVMLCKKHHQNFHNRGLLEKKEPSSTKLEKNTTLTKR